MVDWSHAFDDPSPLPDGRQLVTLKGAADHVVKLPKAEQKLELWQTEVSEPCGSNPLALPPPSWSSELCSG